MLIRPLIVSVMCALAGPALGVGIFLELGESSTGGRHSGEGSA
jgi:hypothetical protein